MRLLAEELLDLLDDQRRPRLSAHHNHLVDLGGGLLGIGQRLLAGLDALLHQFAHQLLQLGARQGDIKVLGPAGVGGNEGQVDIGLLHGGKLALGLLGGFLESLQRHLVLFEVYALVFFKLVTEPVHNPLVEVVVLFLVQPVGQGGRRRLVDYTQHVKPGYLTRVLGRLTLAVVEIGGHGDDRIGDLLTEIGFSISLELLQNHGRYFGRAVFLVAHLHPGVAVSRLGYLIGQQFSVVLHGGLVELAPHQPLDAGDSIIGVGDGLPLGDLSHQALAGLTHGHHRRRYSPPLGVGDDLGLPRLHNRHRGKGGA
ncbi:hypothetical protein ES703_106214 [subsurface metagenome]